MAVKLFLATPDDAAEIAALRTSAEGGKRPVTTNEIARNMREGRVYIARRRGKIVATLCLTKKKPWAIDRSHFTPVETALYLIAMAVLPSQQRRGIGRECLLAAEQIAAKWPAQAIRLDAYDRATGAGGFYERCGYREVGRAVYRATPLIYYERLLLTREERK